MSDNQIPSSLSDGTGGFATSPDPMEQGQGSSAKAVVFLVVMVVALLAAVGFIVYRLVDQIPHRSSGVSETDGGWSVKIPDNWNPFADEEPTTSVATETAEAAEETTGDRASPYESVMIEPWMEQALPPPVADALTATMSDDCTLDDIENPIGEIIDRVYCQISGGLTDPDTGRTHSVYGAYFYNDPETVRGLLDAEPFVDEVPLDVSLPDDQLVRMVQMVDVTTVYHVKNNVLGVYGVSGVGEGDIESLLRAMGLDG